MIKLDRPIVEFQDLGATIRYEQVQDSEGPLPYYSVKRNGRLLGLVSAQYCPMRVDPIIEAIKTHAPSANVDVKERGNIVSAVVKLEDFKLQEKVSPEEELGNLIEWDYKGSGSYCYPAFFISNSYDGSARLDMDGGLYRLICSNGLMVGESWVRKSFWHRKTYQIGVAEVEKIVVEMTCLFQHLTNPNIFSSVEEIEELASKLRLGKKTYKKYVEPVVQNLRVLRLWTAVNLFTYIFTRVKSIYHDQAAWHRAQAALRRYIQAKVGPIGS